MPDFEFKPEDFAGLQQENELITYLDCATIANAKLKEWLDKAPEVFNEWDGCAYKYYWLPLRFKNKRTTHKAKLVCLEKIEDK